MARRLTINNRDLRLAGKLISEGEVGAVTFNGIYGLFGDPEKKEVTNLILKIKERPEDKNLILTANPRYLNEQVDFSKSYYTHDQVVKVQTEVLGLGIVLPALEEAPKHLVKNGTILNIWTEYEPLKTIIDEFRSLGGKALVGTSANKHGGVTIHETEELWKVFGNELDFIVEADHSKFPPEKRVSTSVIDMTGKQPRLHRLGSVSVEEIEKALKKAGIKERLLVDEEKVLYVKKN